MVRFAAAKYTVNSDIRPPALTATRWVWRLASQYYLSYTYPLLIEQAAQRFKQADNSILTEWALEKVSEERGHYLLALNDIKSLGYDAKVIVDTLIPPAAKILVDYLTRSVQDENPIDCVGYSYTMERMALGIGEEYIQKVQALFPPGINTTRCLRTHSNVGGDVEHVDETVEIIAGLTSPERVRIARSCYETALICFSPSNQGYMTDEILQPILNKLNNGKSQ